MKPKDSEKKSIHEKQPLYKQNFISEQINTHWLPYQNNIIDALIDEFTNTKYISRGSLIKVFPEANKAFLKELNQKI